MSGRRKPGSSCCGGSGINDKRRRSGFHLWVERGKTVQLARGHAFQVYVDEGAHAGAGSRKSATLLQGSEHTEPSKNRKENKILRQHLVAETEMVCADDRYPPAFPFGELAINRFDIVFDIAAFGA